MRSIVLASLALLLFSDAVHAAPQLLLSSQRLRRMQRERERQTPRWLNFENRIKTVPGSPERGFELALYSVVAGDEERGREAVDWAQQHRSCDAGTIRQSLVVHNWVADAPANGMPEVPNDCAEVKAGDARSGDKDSIPALRNALIADLAAGRQPDSAATAQVIQALQGGAYRQGPALYAAVEFLALLKEATRVDPRQSAARFFLSLPSLLLLGLKPARIEHPDWQTHVAALALVSIDPNSDGGQFLQGWAIEDRHTLREGPGVAYELLWADPYLPSVGYQNLDPWFYDDEKGTLIARADWTAQPCWINLTAEGSGSENCPGEWETKTTHFGHLTLVPFNDKCVAINRAANETVIFSRLTPGQKLRYEDGGNRKHQVANAGPAGLWRVPVTATGKVCTSR